MLQLNSIVMAKHKLALKLREETIKYLHTINYTNILKDKKRAF